MIPRSLVDGTGGSPRKGRYINDGRADATVVAALPLFVVIAVGAHLVMSGSQTLCHYSLGHHPLGGAFFRNHIRFHHTIYARGHLVLASYHGDQGNNAPYFLIPTILVAGAIYLILH